MPPAGPGPPFLLECAKQGKTGRFEVFRIERTTPSEDVAARLDVLTDSESVLRRENVFYADSDPVHRVTTYIPWPIAEGTSLLDPEVGHPYGIHGILEERGHTMSRLGEEVGARMPTADEAELLHLSPGVPVLNVLHTSIDQAGQPHELTRFVMRTTRLSWLTERNVLRRTGNLLRRGNMRFKAQMSSLWLFACPGIAECRLSLKPVP